MPPKAKPCGTEAAYRRHHRLGEEPCDLCLDAHADRQRRMARNKRAKELGIPIGRISRPPVATVSPAVVEGTKEWELDKLRRALARIELALQEALPREVPGLVREQRAVIVEIAKLTGNRGDGKGGNPLDELAKRRAERLAAASA